MDLTAFIRELLFGHDCVIVPGFGGFVCNYMPSRIDRSSGTFYPPVRQISFNRNIVQNDGLLIQKICSTGITYGDARSMVEEFVAGIRKKLERGEVVSLEKIGMFRKNHEGSLEFEPDTNVNYHLDSFGLEPFRCFPLEGYDVRKRITGEEVHRPVFRRYLWRAAVIIPLAIAFVAVSLKTNLFRPGMELTTMNPLVNAELEHNRAAVDSYMAAGVIKTDDTAVQGEQEVAAPIVTPATDDAAAEPAAESKTAANEYQAPATETKSSDRNSKIVSVKQYYIITGSFHSEENAGKQVKLLQAEGFNPEVVPGGNGFYRVCAMACPDLQTAIEKKDSIDGKFPGSWISRKK